MAKKKKHHKTTRRRRVGGIHAKGIMNDVMEAGGFLLAHIGGGMIQKNLTSINPKIIAGAQLVGGFMLKHKAKSGFMQGVSYGLIGAGAVGIAHDFGIIRGIDNFINGIDSQEYINDGMRREIPEKTSGLGNDQYLNGIPNDYSLGSLGVVA